MLAEPDRRLLRYSALQITSLEYAVMIIRLMLELVELPLFSKLIRVTALRDTVQEPKRRTQRRGGLLIAASILFIWQWAW